MSLILLWWEGRPKNMPLNYKSELWDTVNRASELWYKDSSGQLVQFAGLILTSTASIGRIETPVAVVSSNVRASGASISGTFPIHPTWGIAGFASGATAVAGKPLPVPVSGSWQWFTLTSRTPVSGASLTIDVFKNYVSIFDTGTRPAILGGGTLVSTASIATKAFIGGDIFTVDIINGGNVADLTVIGRGIG